jgi:hypothetical protein
VIEFVFKLQAERLPALLKALDGLSTFVGEPSKTHRLNLQALSDGRLAVTLSPEQESVLTGEIGRDAIRERWQT